MVADDVLVGDPASRDRELKRQTAAGVGLIRLTIAWSGIETAPGRYAFGSLDAQVAATARRHIELLPILFAPPPFRSSAPNQGARRGTYPPARPADMARFAAVLVRRYGPRGRFWSAHPDTPKVPIRRWQVWNEPNLPVYWPPGPDPSAYARLLTATARGIKAGDPAAEVISAGLAQSRLGVPFDEFVRGMYRAGAGKAIDSFALHPYARDALGVLHAVRHTRALLAQLGEHTPIRVTELGWASGGPRSPFTVGEQGQASRIRRALVELASRRRELGVEGVVYFNWKDSQPFAGGHDFFGLHTGLLREDGTAKPALSAFSKAAARVAR
jgi:phage tail protein X